MLDTLTGIQVQDGAMYPSYHAYPINHAMT